MIVRRVLLRLIEKLALGLDFGSIAAVTVITDWMPHSGDSVRCHGPALGKEYLMHSGLMSTVAGLRRDRTLGAE